MNRFRPVTFWLRRRLSAIARWWNHPDTASNVVFTLALAAVGIGLAWWWHPGLGLVVPGLIVVAVMLYSRLG